ncbi:MAG: CD225/dispanin family protein [Rikenellaceae bacterium]|nr:CD225/dispanin family protein [Rikenellaceae bacterium]MBR3800492.1 CD225/dispanin family protein [Rikenellaceae bacterium]
MEVINNNTQTNRPNRYPPKNHLVEAILVTIFCCLPFGIVGIINAARVENAFYSGDEMEAERLSREALKWVKIAFFTGIAAVVIYLIFVVFIAWQMANDGF